MSDSTLSQEATPQRSFELPQGSSRVLSRIAQCALICLAAGAIALLLALTSGLLAVILVYLFKQSLSADQIKAILDAYTAIITLAAAPVMFHALFVSLKNKTDNHSWLRLAMKSLRFNYLRLAILITASLVVGAIIFFIFGYLPNHLALLIIERVLLLAIGVVAIYLMARAYWPKNHQGSTGTHYKRDKTKESPQADNFPELPLLSKGRDSFSYKALRTALALLLVAGSVPSAWLYALSDMKMAYAEPTAAQTDVLEQTGTPNEYEADNQEQVQNDAFLKEPNLTEEPDDPEGALLEIAHDRYSTTWLNLDGTYTTRIQNEPLTYTNEKGHERDIDNTLIMQDESFSNKENSYKVNLPKEGQSISFEKDGYQLDQTPLFGSLKDAVAIDNAILYNNIAEGIDLQYSVFGSQVKEDIILNYPSTLDSFDFELKAQDITFSLEGNTVLGFAKNTDAGDKDEPVFVIDAPMMMDAAGEVSTGITLELDTTQEGALLRIIPDKVWLSAPTRAWPVIIDPSHALSADNLTQRTIQEYYRPPSADPDMEHDVPYLYVGFEDGTLINIWENGDWITYGESWSFLKINNITPYITDLPDKAILSAKLSAYKYSTVGGDSVSGLPIDAKMVEGNWNGDGRYTWLNRPRGAQLTYLDTQYTPAGKSWMHFDITDAFKEWKRDPASNKGIMLTPLNEGRAQPAVAFSGTGNVHGQQALYIDLSWTLPKIIDEDMALDAPNVNLRPLTYKNPIGYQNFVGVFADGLVRPALELDYILIRREDDGSATLIAIGAYPKTEYECIYPDSTPFKSIIPFSLGFVDLYESNWQTDLFPGMIFEYDTLYRIDAKGIRVYDVWANPDSILEETPWGHSDTFIIYEVKQQDTLSYIAAYYGVTRQQLALDNRVGDDLLLPGNTLFIRNPNANATIPYTRPDELTLEQKRSLIYANMGRSQTSEFDMEPVNMNTGNFYLEHTDATSYEYASEFNITRSYNSLAPQSSGLFGRGWTSLYQQTLTALEDGSITYITDDGRHLVFDKQGDIWLSPQGYNLRLERHDAVSSADVTYTITRSDKSSLTFDCYGVLRSLSSASGLETKIAYDKNCHITSITTETGRIYKVSTDFAGHIESITLPNGSTVDYTYNKDGYLSSVTDPDGATIRYEYDAKGQMSAAYDGEGNQVIANTYDDEGRVITQTDARGNISTVVYEQGKSILTDALGIQTTYSYNDSYQTTSIERDGVVRHKSYNSGGQLLSETDGLGRVSSYNYDTFGNLSRIGRSDGTFQEITYDDDAHPLTVRDFDGALVHNTYDKEGNLISRMNADGTIVFYSYDGYGRMASITDELGNITTFKWDGISSLDTTDGEGNTSTTYFDAMGRPFSEINALGIEHKSMYSPAGKLTGTWQSGGITTALAYDRAGNCIATTDERSVTTNYSYDAAGNLINVQAPTGASLSFTYDAASNKTSQTDAKGNKTSYTYDAFGRLTSTTDALGACETSVYDNAGRLVFFNDKAGNLSIYGYSDATDKPTQIALPQGLATYRYDAAGRILEEQLPDGTSSVYTYDERGNVTSTTDESGLVLTSTYDEAGRLIKQGDTAGRTESHTYNAVGSRTSTTDALGQTTTFGYDKAYRLISLTAPGKLTTRFEYDEQGDITKLTRTDGSVLIYEYDGAGNLIKSTDGTGATTLYDYTALGDIAAVTDAAGGITTYAYDADQMLLSQTGPLTETVSYIYDELNRPVVITDALGNESKMSWDASGQVTGITAADGSVLRTAYDSAGHIIKTEDAAGLITTYEYDSYGHLTRQSDNAGFLATFTYDASGRLISQTDALGRKATFDYDAWGNLIATTDLNADTTEFSYDIIGRLIKMKKSTGEMTTYRYDAAGNIIKTTDAQKRSTTYTYDKLGQVLTKTDAAGQVWRYTYDAQGNLTSIKDPEGITTKSDFDALGRMSSQTDGRGNSTGYTWDLSSNLIALSQANGATLKFSYDANKNLTAEKDASGFVTAYEYDELGRLIQMTDPLGAKDMYAYDAHGNLVLHTDAMGYKTSYSYSLADARTKTCYPNGLEESYTYDKAGRITSFADTYGVFVSFSYDRAGNVIKQTDQDGAKTSFSYDKAHRLISSTDALGAITSFRYDKAGNLISSKLPSGASYSYSYDELNRMVTGKFSGSLPVAYTYDSKGNVLSTTQGDKVLGYTYDKAGNLITQKDALGKSSTVTYDEMNLPIAFKDRVGNTSEIGYDLSGRPISRTDALGATSTYAYDGSGNLIKRTDSLGNETSYAYDKVKNLTSLKDSLGRLSTYTYDGMGNITSLTQSATSSFVLYAPTAQSQAQAASQVKAQKTTYEYDLHSNLTKITSPAGEVERFTYDVKDRLSTKTTSGSKTTTYDYDKLGQLIAKNLEGDGTKVTYGYNSSGNRLSMDDSSGHSAYDYNKAGQLVSYTQSDGRTLRYAYDEYGRMSRITYPDGRYVSYTYDLTDNLILVQDSVSGDTSYTYDAEGNVLSCARPDGTLTSYKYDKANRLVKLVNKRQAKTLSSFAYTYDTEGRIASEELFQDASQDQEGLSLSRAFSYDAAGELIGYTEDDGTDVTKTSYGYDLQGNRFAKTTDGKNSTVQTSEYDKYGRLIKQTDSKTGISETFAYDGDGNLILRKGAGEEITYSYDAENRLKAVREGGELLMAASYDGDGNRIFQMYRTLVPYEYYYGQDADGKKAKKPTLKDTTSLIPESFELPKGDTPSNSGKAISDIELKDHAFLYGFALELTTFACAPDMAFVRVAQTGFEAAFSALMVINLEIPRADDSSNFDDGDLKALADAGLDEQDIGDVTNPKVVEPDKAKDSGKDDSTIIPLSVESGMRYDYELTYYVNDISYANVQVVQEYGSNASLKESYTYGIERISATDAYGTLSTYLYDGQGSVAQVQSGSAPIKNISYDPFGQIQTSIDPYQLIFAHNAEEYNPVTNLTYLRARYYAPDSANFITKDSYLGNVLSINSQNRYSYAQADPINNADPTGHAISNDPYERQLEAAGGINEMYNFYVGHTLSNTLIMANSAFNAQLNYAYGVDYRSLAAINSIAGISQATADAYINYGAYLASNAGRTWGCKPGSLVNLAITSFSKDVNKAKDAVNVQIANVKANKYDQYQQYQAYLAYLAYLAFLAEEEARRQRNLAIADLIAGMGARGALMGAAASQLQTAYDIIAQTVNAIADAGMKAALNLTNLSVSMPKSLPTLKETQEMIKKGFTTGLLNALQISVKVNESLNNTCGTSVAIAEEDYNSAGFFRWVYPLSLSSGQRTTYIQTTNDKPVTFYAILSPGIVDRSSVGITGTIGANTMGLSFGQDNIGSFHSTKYEDSTNEVRARVSLEDLSFILSFSTTTQIGYNLEQTAYDEINFSLAYIPVYVFAPELLSVVFSSLPQIMQTAPAWA